MNEKNMKKMDDPHFKNVIIFILFIFLLFFLSNDKNLNKIFQKNIVKILFVITLVYMAYLKINICIILAVLSLFLLFNTNIGKKLQKNRYIKRMIKLFSPYVQPIIYAIEDFVASFTEIPDDESSVGSSSRKQVRFNDEYQDELDDLDDLDLADEEIKKSSKSQKNQSQNESNIDFDILDEIRNDMNLKVPEEDENENETILEKEDEEEEEIIGEAKPDAILDHHDVKKLYQELASVKDQLSNIDE